MSKQIKVGLIALISGVILYWGFNYLKGNDFFSPTHKYYVIYDKIEGLTKSNPVIINGLQVGRISNIRLLQKQNNLILVEMDIEENIILGDSTVALLANTDFLGSKAVVLNVGSLSNPILPGDTLIADIDKGFNDILESATPVANNLNTTITRVNEILIGLKGSGETINETLKELKDVTIRVNAIMAENQGKVADVVSSSAILIDNINDKVNRLNPVFDKVNQTLDTVNNLELKQTLARVDSLLISLNEATKLLKDNNGTLGKLMSEDSAYQNLNRLLIDLDKLVIHFNEYPKDFMKPLGRKSNKLEGLKE